MGMKSIFNVIKIKNSKKKTKNKFILKVRILKIKFYLDASILFFLLSKFNFFDAFLY